MAAISSSDERQKEVERMHDVLLLLNHLIKNEKTTIKLILDCLYEVGAVNLINKKVPIVPANRLLKSIAMMSKPVFRVFALRWFEKNCPLLIVNWLHSKVSFKALDKKPQKPAQPRPANPQPQAINLQPQVQLLTDNATQEIKRLRAQVRIMTVMLIGVTVLGGMTVWQVYNLNFDPLQPIRRIESANVRPQG